MNWLRNLYAICLRLEDSISLYKIHDNKYLYMYILFMNL